MGAVVLDPVSAAAGGECGRLLRPLHPQLHRAVGGPGRRRLGRPCGRCCVYAYVMDAAMLVKAAREDANLTVRELAERAGVAASTVSRIERRHMDPTIGMLDRLLDAAGHDLELSARRSHQGRLGALADAWRVHADGSDRPDWTRLRVFLDYLWLHPELIQASIADKPDPSGSQVMDNLLAAMAEKLSDDAELPRPSWTAEIPGLSRPWCTPATPRMHAAAQSATPPQLAARGFVLASNSLWRDRWNEIA